MALAVLGMLCAAGSLTAPAMLARPWGAPIVLQQVAVVATPEAAAPLLAVLTAAERIAPADAVTADGLAWRPELLPRSLLLVGGIHDNPALLPLYGGYLSFGDAAYPGGDGYVIRTVAAPFGAGTQAIVVETSTPAGTAAGVARLAELVRQSPGGRLAATLEAHLPANSPARTQWLVSTAHRYALCGGEKVATEAWTALLAAANERGYFDAGDYGIERWVRDALLMQDAPVGNAAEHLRLDQALFTTCQLSLDQYWRARDGRAIGGRHQTMGTSAFAAAVQLLRRRGAPNEEARALLDQWWAQAGAYWRNACTTFHDDLEGFPIYCSAEPAVDQAFAFGYADYLREQLPLAALRAIAATDNQGYYCGAGTYEECRPGDVYKPMPLGWLLSVADYFQPGRGWRWLATHFPNAYGWTWASQRGFGGARTFANGREQLAPEQMLGAMVVPLGNYRHRRLPPPAPPAERCFEKLAGRDSFAPDGQYFVLQGYQSQNADNVVPLDNNNLIRFCDLGHVWLHSNSEKQGPLYRNAVSCSDGVSTAAPATACELTALADRGKVVLVASRLAQAGPGDWTRNVVWLRGGYLVLIDQVRSSRAGRFALSCSFRTPQSAELTADGLLAREGDATFRVRNADRAVLSLEGGREQEGAAVPTLLRQSQVLDGPAGAIAEYRNLLCAADSAHPAELELRPAGPGAVLVRGRLRGTDELALIAAGDGAAGLAVGPFESDGVVLYVGSAGVAQAGGGVVKLSGRKLDGSDAGVRAALEDLWQRSAAAQHPTAAGTGRAAQQVWQAAPFSALPAPVAAPTLVATPAGDGLPGTLFDRIVPRNPTMRWPAGDVTLQLDLRQAQLLTQIDCQVGLMGSYNQILDPAKLPPPRTVAAEFSRDGFATDRRTRLLRFTADCTYENIHKGSVWPILRLTCRDVAEAARQVRLTFTANQWPGGLALNELSLRPGGPSGTRLQGWLRRDVDGDGRPELLCWSDQAELAVLGDDGRPRWRRALPGFITAAECYAELGPQPRILLTTREARLYCLDSGGQELWRTDFVESAKQNGDLPIGYSLGLLRSPDGQPLIVVGNYNLATFVSGAGQVLRYQRLPGAYQTLTMSRGGNLDGSGDDSLLSGEVWGTLSLLDATLKLRRTLRMPRGRAVALCPWDGDGVLVCTENGAGRLKVPTLAYDWQLALSPINDAVLGDFTGAGQTQLAVAKHDGYLLVYNNAGKLQRSLLLPAPPLALAAVPGRPAILVAALPDQVVRIDGDRLTLVVAGRYDRLLPGGAGGELYGATAGGVIERLQL